MLTQVEQKQAAGTETQQKLDRSETSSLYPACRQK